MLKKLFSIKRNKGKKHPNFFDMSAGDRKKIVKKAVEEGSKDQLALIKKYNEKFGVFDAGKCE